MLIASTAEPMQLATPTLTPTTPGKVSFNVKPKTPVELPNPQKQPVNAQQQQQQQLHQQHQQHQHQQMKSPKSQRHEQLKTYLQHNTPPPAQQVNNYTATAPILDHMSSFFSAPAKHQQPSNKPQINSPSHVIRSTTPMSMMEQLSQQRLPMVTNNNKPPAIIQPRFNNNSFQQHHQQQQPQFNNSNNFSNSPQPPQQQSFTPRGQHQMAPQFGVGPGHTNFMPMPAAGQQQQSFMNNHFNFNNQQQQQSSMLPNRLHQQQQQQQQQPQGGQQHNFSGNFY